ncbi:MAG: hypothetical protein AB8F26_06140 [Phycisphaerales bacterium]
MSDLHQRLHDAIGKTTFRRLGDLTDTHPETVRRYMQGQSPSAPFLSKVCASFGICGEWLLTGKGPMKISEMRQHALREADASELLGAIAKNLSDLGERMDRLERFVQGLETRVRGSARTMPKDERTNGQPAFQANSSGPGPALSSDKAVGRIRDAVAKRASSDADGAPQAVRA